MLITVLWTCSENIKKDGQCRALKQVELTYVVFTQMGHISREAMTHEGYTWAIPLVHVSDCQQYKCCLCVIIMTHSSSGTMEDCNYRDKL